MPTVHGKYLTRSIGAPIDYTQNKEKGSFPDSYDLKVPRDPSTMEAEGGAGSPPQRNPEEEVKDTHMRSATPAKPADAYMPIRALNQFTNDWVVKARVVKKAEMRQWKNAKSSGNLLNFDLVDKEGTMIQATAFNDAAVQMNELLEAQCIYTFKNGMVKLANKRFTSIPNDFCLTFSRELCAERCDEDEEI